MYSTLSAFDLFFHTKDIIFFLLKYDYLLEKKVAPPFSSA